MDVLFTAVALVCTLEMTEAFPTLETITRQHGNDVRLNCLNVKEHTWNDLQWNRITTKKGHEMIGRAGIMDQKSFNCSTSSEHFRVTRTTDSFSIEIFKVEPKDGGIYFCLQNKSLATGTGFNISILHVAVLEVEEISTLPTTVGTPGNTTTGNGTQSSETNGTMINADQNLLIQALGGSLGLCVVLILVLAHLSYKRRVCKHCRDTAFQAIQKDGNSSNPNGCQDEDTLNYATVNFTKKGKQKRVEKRPQEETLYAGVKYS